MAPYDGTLDTAVSQQLDAVARTADEARDCCLPIKAELAFLRQLARRWHRDEANANDLVQDTLLQALANAHQWQPGSNLRGWLFVIMRNQFLAGVARERRSNAAVDLIAMEEGGCGLSTGVTETRLVLRDIERALRRLPAPQRTAIRIIGIEGKSYEEAAAQMGLSVAAVRCHLSRGRECLKALVDGGAGAKPRTFSRAAAPPRVAMTVMALA